MRLVASFLVGSACCLLALGLPFDVAAQPGDREESRPTVHVVPLAHAAVDEVQERIGDVAGIQGVEMTVDSRTNCIILTGDVEGIEAIQALCEVLDTAPRMIDTEIAIYELRGEAALQEEFTPDILQDSEDVRMIRRIRLQSLENQPTMIQLGEMVPVKTGESFSPGGGRPQATYQMQDLGTLVNYVARVSDETITMELAVETSRLVETSRRVEASRQVDANLPETFDEVEYPSTTLGQLQTTVILESGVPTVVGDFSALDSPADTRFVVLVTASVR